MKKIGMILLFLAGTLTANFASNAAELNGKKFEDKITVNGKELVLNGLGLRTVQRYGITIKVYVMGIYLPKKESDAKAILASQEMKHFKMVFMRSVDSKTIRDGWRKGYLANCEADCESTKDNFREFNDLMSDMRDDKTISVTILKDKVDVDVQGHKSKSASIQSEAFARALPKIWLGSNPPTPEFKKGVLGL